MALRCLGCGAWGRGSDPGRALRLWGHVVGRDVARAAAPACVASRATAACIPAAAIPVPALAADRGALAIPAATAATAPTGGPALGGTAPARAPSAPRRDHRAHDCASLRRRAGPRAPRDPPGSTILLAGEAGVGKSTVAAELAAAVAEARRGLSYWLDRDQQAHDLIAALFSRTASPIDRVVLVEECDPKDPDYEPLTWATALKQVPADAACLVVDSLETWANTYAEQFDFARAVYIHRASVKIVLAGTNAAGDVEGLARLHRVGEALVVLEASWWLVRKCRWLPGCPQRFPRQRLNDRDEPPEDEAPPHVMH